jgi:hypothetical protein
MTRLTRQEAIEAFCKQCIYDPGCGGGTWKEQVSQCTAVRCPLWRYRPIAEGQWADAPTNPETVDTPAWFARVRAAQTYGGGSSDE